MSLYRIPFILAAMTTVEVSCYQPNPSSDSQVTVFSWETIRGLRNVNYQVMSVRIGAWIPALAEIAVILAQAFPEHKLSTTVLSILRPSSGYAAAQTSRLFLAALSIAAVGAALRVWCYSILRKHYTFVVTLGKDHDLVTSGPYKVVRHPGYTGWAAMAVGVFSWHMLPGSWVRESGILNTTAGKVAVVLSGLPLAAATIMLLTRARNEDQVLQARYGKKWNQWAQQVRWRVMPGIY